MAILNAQKNRLHFGNDRTRLFCVYRFINHICKVRLANRLINFKLIPGLSDRDCIVPLNVEEPEKLRLLLTLR